MRHYPISLCMIVRDEAEHLPRCLRSVQGIADEIIVIDTGSTDGTPEIAESFGARVIHYPWGNDFAAARNAGLDSASGYWILFLDADEELDAEGRTELLVCAQHAEYSGFFLQIHNVVGTGGESWNVSVNPVLRMFRSAPEHRFEGRIHEQISPSIYRNNPSSMYHLTNVIIHHYGYRNEVVAKKDKLNRNLRLLLQVLEESPNDPFHLYNIGVEYLRAGQAGQALDAFSRARKAASPELSYTHLIYKSEVRCLQAMGRHAEAVELCASGLKLYPQYTDLLHAKGTNEMKLGRIRDARMSLFAAYQQGAPSAGFHTEIGLGTFVTAYSLGLLHESMPDWRPAAAWYMEVLMNKPEWAAPMRRLIHFMKCRGAERELADMLERQLRFESPEASVPVLDALVEGGCGEAVLLLIGAWGNELTESDRIAYRYKACLIAGDAEGALRELKEEAGADESIGGRDGIATWVERLAAGGVSPDHTDHRNFPSTLEWRLAIRAAAASGRMSYALVIAHDMKNRLATGMQDPGQLLRLARVYADLADGHLGRFGGGDREQSGLVAAARLEVPYEDGM